MRQVERRRVGERLPRPMTQQRAGAFFARLESTRDKALFSLLYGSGLRISEALGLDIEDVRLEEREFRVVGKGNRERIGYLAEDTIKLLRHYLRERGRPRQGPAVRVTTGHSAELRDDLAAIPEICRWAREKRSAAHDPPAKAHFRFGACVPNGFDDPAGPDGPQVTPHDAAVRPGQWGISKEGLQSVPVILLLSSVMSHPSGRSPPEIFTVAPWRVRLSAPLFRSPTADLVVIKQDDDGPRELLRPGTFTTCSCYCRNAN